MSTQSGPTWRVIFASRKAEKQWDSCEAQEPELFAEEVERLKSRPTDRSRNPRRTGSLKGGLGERRIAGKKLPQWQHEITSGGRVWVLHRYDQQDRVRHTGLPKPSKANRVAFFGQNNRAPVPMSCSLGCVSTAQPQLFRRDMSRCQPTQTCH